MSERIATVTNAASPSSAMHAVGLLQRKCDCGNSTIAGEKCPECGKKRLQRKLSIGATDDPLELEADRVADQILATPANSGVGSSPARIQRFAGQSLGKSDAVPASVERALGGSGRPLNPPLQEDMEQRFGFDFSRVRVHADSAAEYSTKEANARAYTVGHAIVFGAGQFSPGTRGGMQLLAHELAHVVQQGSRSAPAIQFACRAPKQFDFAKSSIASQIRDGLGQITVPSRDPGGAPNPRVDPGTVLSILGTSGCFLQDAQTIERTYFARGGPTGGRTTLALRLHENPDIGSQFTTSEPSAHRIYVEVEAGVTTATPQALVRRIVHEIAHATHRPSTPRPPRGIGAVTVVEEAGVAEEAQTRARENEIMAEIAASEGWTDTPTPAKPNDVRASLRSGLPKLTYQEYFIVEEMKRRSRMPGLDEAQAIGAARKMAATGGVEYVSPRSTSTFTFDKGAVARHAEIAASSPVAPPGLDDAMNCARLAQSSRPPVDVSAGCLQLQRILRGEPPLPYEDPPRRARVRDILMKWKSGPYQLQLESYHSSSAFVEWYDGLPPKLKGSSQTLGFFHWLLIAESMSREWQSVSGAEEEVRRRHLEFLKVMIGDGLLRGISAPSAVTK